MSTKEAVRRWYVVHKWTSLISTVFVLIACITGLPLVFHHEIAEMQESAPWNGADSPRVGLAGSAAAAAGEELDGNHGGLDSDRRPSARMARLGARK